MDKRYIEIERRRKRMIVPAFPVGNRTVMVTGRIIRLATVHDEGWIENEPVEDPETFVKDVRRLVKADIFSFSRRLPDINADFPYYSDRDNVAAIPITSFDDWLNERISRKTRQEVNRARRLGIVVKAASFGDEFIGEVSTLFDRISMKQGLPFAHHGKDPQTLKKEIGPYSDRSAYIAAYLKDEFIGYLKMVFMGKLASILNIIADPTHFDKRPGNALLAEAVRICEARNILFLLYGKYAYGNKLNNSLTEFKRRNGFEMIRFPRYHIPLSLWGRIAIRLRLYRGLVGLVPECYIMPLIKLRSSFYRYVWLPLRSIKV